MKFFLICAAFALLSFFVSAKENLIADFSFEGKKSSSGITGSWQEFEFDGAETILKMQEILQGVPHGKKAVLLRRVSGGSLGGITPGKRIAVREQEACTLSTRFRTGKGAYAFLKVDFINDAGVLLGSVSSKDQSSVKWSTLRLAFKTPSGCKSLRVILGLRGQTFAAFDQVVLRIDPKGSGPDWNGFAVRCLPVETVLAWSGKRVFHTFEDSPCALTFQFRGKYNTLRNPALVVDLPAELTLAEAFEQHPSWGRVLKPEVQSFTRNGKNYIRYRFKNPPFFRSLLPSWGWRRMMTLGLLPAAGKDLAGKSFAAYYFLENKGSVSQTESFTIRILKALPEKKMPSDFYVGLWIGYENDYNSRDVFRKALRKLEKSNLIGTVLLSPQKGNNEILRQRKFKMAVGSFHGDQAYQFRYMSKDLQKKVSDRFYCTFYNGKINKSRMCPQFFLTDPLYGKFADESMKKAVNKAAANEMVFLDTEPWRPHNWCYCKNCVEAFRGFAKLSGTPTVRELRGKYYSKWRAFRVEQSRLVIKKLSSLVRKYRPDAVIFDYDYPINYDSRKAIDTFLSRCSKDPRGNEEFIDGHLSSFYHTLDQNMFDLVEINRRHLKKAYYPILAVDPPGYLAKSSVLSPERFRIMSVASAALGCKGIWIYSTSVVDGSTIQGIHDAMVKIAKVEHFYKTPFLVNKSVKVQSDSNVLRYTQHRAGKEQLLTLFNFDQKKSVTVTLSQLPGKVKEALTGKVLPVKNGTLTMKLLPGEEYFLLF